VGTLQRAHLKSYSCIINVEHLRREKSVLIKELRV
jgi:hypothetical protein